MAEIHNSDLSKELRDGAKLQTSRDVIPSQLAEKVVPVMEVNPKLLRETNYILSSSAGSATLDTTPTTKDTYITGYLLIGSTSTGPLSSTMTLTATPKGRGAQIIGGLRYATTAILDTMTQVASVSLPHPILLERNSTIVVANTNITASRVVVYGYQVDNPNA